ncbi:MAG: hypothetical protein C5S52_00005 [ANME-2 cluster archaeon]|nr:hypothetical protein [ANME-2 cluster archaeon]
MKRNMAGEIAPAGARESTEMLMWRGGVVELAPLSMLRIMADEGRR